MKATCMPNSIPRLLIIDDQLSARVTIEAILAPCGYHLDFAASGEEGLTKLRSQHYDVVLCDILMPRMSGFAVCQTINAHPEWKLTPVIVVSGLDSHEDIARGLDAGAADFITRPFDPLVFRARVRAALRTRTSYKALTPKQVDVTEALRRRRSEIVQAAALTDRETEVLELVLLGRSHQDIADALNISPRTSKFHLHNLNAKLGAESRSDLLRIFA